jgi:hypothetical protein
MEQVMAITLANFFIGCQRVLAKLLQYKCYLQKLPGPSEKFVIGLPITFYITNKLTTG